MVFSRRTLCRLLALPAEIRNLIFEYAVTPEKPVVTFRPDHYQTDIFLPAIQPPLTRVSRQIRAESLPIYYECNDFILHAESPKIDDALSWLRCICLHLRLLRRLSFWLRYVPPANARTSSQGAIQVSIVRPKKTSPWQVDDQWKWVTVVRKPAELQNDAKFILEKLNIMTGAIFKEDASPDDYLGLLKRLREDYIQEKTS